MALEFQEEVVKSAVSITGARLVGSPPWLNRPGRSECGHLWDLVQGIYRQLADRVLPEVMPARERRTVDAVLEYDDGTRQILEVDEAQHFNKYRAATLRSYLDSPVAFDREAWLKACDKKRRLEGGGFAVPKPPLFPGDNGRHKQRAFRDALCDLLPPEHGFHPTARIAYFEASQGLDRLLRSRLADSSSDSESDTILIGENHSVRSASGESGSARTQRVTENDLRTGQIRIPSSAKHLFPPSDTTVTVVLRGWKTSPLWRPRYGPDRERSGVLRIGSQDLGDRVAADEILYVRLDDSDQLILE
jgi:hypothetical protein